MSMIFSSRFTGTTELHGMMGILFRISFKMFFEGKKNIEQVLRSSLLFIRGSTTSETSLGKVRITSSMG